MGFKPVQGNVVVDEFTSVGANDYTMSQQPTNTNALEVIVGGLTQSSSAYSFSGTTLTVAGVASGTKIIVRQHGEKLQIPIPGDDTVTAIKIAANAVTEAKIANDAVTAAKIHDDVALGGPSLGTSSVMRTNANTISENITVPSGTNAMSVGPMTLAVGNTITVNGVYTVI